MMDEPNGGLQEVPRSAFTEFPAGQLVIAVLPFRQPTEELFGPTIRVYDGSEPINPDATDDALLQFDAFDEDTHFHIGRGDQNGIERQEGESPLAAIIRQFFTTPSGLVALLKDARQSGLASKLLPMHLEGVGDSIHKIVADHDRAVA